LCTPHASNHDNLVSTAITPKISVILTAYNFAPYIVDAVQSLLAQVDAPSFELLIFDDASTDGTQALLQGFSDPRIQLHLNPVNQGVAVTLTRAFALARGEYIARLDGDDRWLPNFLSATSAILDQHGEVGYVYGEVAIMNGKSELSANPVVAARTQAGKKRELKTLLADNYICAPALLARRSAWALAEPWQARFAMGPGDWYASLCMAETTEGYFLNQILAHYRVHDGGMHRAMMRSAQGEQATMFILERFLEGKTAFSASEKRRIRAHCEIDMAKAYCAYARFEDAKRLTLAAAWRWPALLRSSTNMRLWLGALLGFARYAKLKAFWRRS
jgi:glycosyltransferase involved in cell wall biosynthesis